MGDTDDDRPPSPPLARGAYNLNFDDFDENTDPFGSKGGLANSPGKDIPNPFSSSNKMASSPPLPSHMNKQNIPEKNPFKTKAKLGSSPPQSDTIDIADSSHGDIDSGIDSASVNTVSDTSIHEDSTDSSKTAIESPMKQDSNKQGLKTRAKTTTPPVAADDMITNGGEGDSDNVPHTTTVPDEIQTAKKTPQKKTASPKKSGMKKPKARSKFKPPANFGVQDSEDVVIFAPPPLSSNQDQTANEMEAPSETANETPADTSACDNELINSDNKLELANQIPEFENVGGVSEMIDSVHDFGAREMAMENNEGAVPESEAFNEDDEAWDMMQKMNSDENVPAGRESLCAFDPLAEVPDKVTTKTLSDPSLDQNCSDSEDLLLMNTPPSVKQSGASRGGPPRHPAARALQDQVDGNGGVPREAHIVDKMLFSPVKGEELKPTRDGVTDEKYFDALEYPLGSRRAGQAESEVERMNTVNKKHGVGMGQDHQDNIVQLVQDQDNQSSSDKMLKYSQSDWNKMRQDMELDYNARILNKEREWSKKLADRDKKISYLEEQTLLLRSSNEDMKGVVTEFEKIISTLQADKEKSSSESQQSYGDLVKERDQALEDLQSVETAFSDLHQRYERTKGVVEGFKKNEDILKKCVQDYQVKLKTAEDKTVSVRQQAEDKLDQASQEMEKLRRSTTAEVARLEAGYKKADLKIQGLERSLDQKVSENEELTAICDELINKVGSD